MHLLCQRIERHLAHSSMGALPIQDLVQRLRCPATGRGPDAATILLEADRWPDRFRVVDPWHPRPAGAPSPALVREAVRDGRSAREPTSPAEARWVVLVEAVRTLATARKERPPPRRIADRLRESVLHLAERLDRESLRSLARWIRLAGSGNDTGGRFSPA